MQGKEYVVDGKLVGKDVPSTASPQAYGLVTKSAFVAELQHQLSSAGNVGVDVASHHQHGMARDKAGQLV